MPQTVPNRPTKGAVDPTEASTARPPCMRAVDSSMELRIARVSHSLGPSESCSWSCAWWWAAASRPSSASARKGLAGSVPSLFRPSAKSAECQKLSMLRDWRRKRCRSTAFMTITIQEASDIASSMTATALLTMSPWLQRWARPNSVFIAVVSFEDELDWDVEPHGFRHAAALARNVAPFAHGFECDLVQAIVAAGLLDLGVLRVAVRPDQDAQDHLALFAQALARGRVRRLGILQVVGAAGRQFDPGRRRGGRRCDRHGRAHRGRCGLRFERGDGRVRSRREVGCSLQLGRRRWRERLARSDGPRDRIARLYLRLGVRRLDAWRGRRDDLAEHLHGDDHFDGA